MSAKDTDKLDYKRAGVTPINEQDVMRELTRLLRPTFQYAGKAHEVLIDFGFYANVIRVSDEMGIALATDGVGTKILIAEMMGRYDTIGIDCIAMNVNDIVCVGAKPVALVDYIAVERTAPEQLTAIARGLAEGARIAEISIPGGEIAQLGEMIRGARQGSGFDLVGTAIGTVPIDRIITGDRLADGDVVIGVASSGIHSNGLTLARKVLFGEGKYTVDSHLELLGKTVGEELLTPTHVYARPVVEILGSGVDVRALIHITGDGFLNLLRVQSEVGFVIDHAPEPQPIFRLIQDTGGIPDEEMYYVYNMGVGFCVVVPRADADKVAGVFEAAGFTSFEIGHVDSSIPGVVRIPAKKLRSARGGFIRE